MRTPEKVLLAILLTATSPGALAYLDPGTGSIIIQALIATFAMAGVVFRMFWFKVRTLLGFEPKVDAQESTTAHESAE